MRNAKIRLMTIKAVLVLLMIAGSVLAADEIQLIDASSRDPLPEQ